jgi:hypothetical protein
MIGPTLREATPIEVYLCEDCVGEHYVYVCLACGPTRKLLSFQGLYTNPWDERDGKPLDEPERIRCKYCKALLELYYVAPGLL